MKKILAIVASLFLAGQTLAQGSKTIYLWPGQVPGETEAKHDPVQTDNTSGNVIRISDITNPALIVFEPNESKKNGSSVIVCPGGGHRILAVDKEGYEIAEWLNTLGYTVFVLQYRVPQKQEGAFMDIQRAIRIVRSGAKKWEIDPDKIGVIGFSAGGSLAAVAATRFNEETYATIDQIDSLAARPNFALLIYPAYLDNGENRSLTPELTITDKTPPTFIFATADDRLANSALVYAGALRDSKIPVELHLLPVGGHGYGMRKGNAAAETWPKLAEVWLNNLK
ncbi:MAG: acetyl esterase/lipase [Cyclobacteriaceae bacterium]|jgi:acetyl esterase/lipase